MKCTLHGHDQITGITEQQVVMKSVTLLTVLVAKSAVMKWPFINFQTSGTKPEEKSVCDTK